MSEVKRVSDDAEEYVSNNKTDDEDWMEALDRLLGINQSNDTEYITRSEAEELMDSKIREAQNTRY